MMKEANPTKLLSKEDFVFAALEKLRKPGYAGIHVVFSGFNEAFREYFKGADPIAFVDGLVEKGVLEKRPARGGVIIKLAEKKPGVPGKKKKDGPSKVQSTLNKILG